MSDATQDDAKARTTLELAGGGGVLIVGALTTYDARPVRPAVQGLPAGEPPALPPT